MLAALAACLIPALVLGRGAGTTTKAIQVDKYSLIINNASAIQSLCELKVDGLPGTLNSGQESTPIPIDCRSTPSPSIGIQGVPSSTVSALFPFDAGGAQLNLACPLVDPTPSSIQLSGAFRCPASGAATLELRSSAVDPSTRLGFAEPPMPRASIATSAELVLQHDVRFDFDHRTPNTPPTQLSQTLEALRHLLKLQQSADFLLIIEGHASSEGTEEYNDGLSTERACRLRWDIVQSNLQTLCPRTGHVGLGERIPVGTRSCENRRAEFRLVSSKDLPNTNLLPCPMSPDDCVDPRAIRNTHPPQMPECP